MQRNMQNIARVNYEFNVIAKTHNYEIFNILKIKEGLKMIISKYQDKLYKNNTCTQLILLEAYNSSVHIILHDRFTFKSKFKL